MGISDGYRHTPGAHAPGLYRPAGIDGPAYCCSIVATLPPARGRLHGRALIALPDGRRMWVEGGRVARDPRAAA